LKELRETLRDKRVLLAVFVSPLLVTPLLLMAMGLLLKQKVETEREEVLPIGIVSGFGLPVLEAAMRANLMLTIESPADRDAAETAVRDGSLRAALIVPPDGEAELAGGTNISVEVLFLGSNEKSNTARRRIEGAVRDAKADEVGRRLKAHDLDSAALEPIGIESADLATSEESGGFLLGSILPYVVIISAAFGGMTTAFDLCAGEKERGTMETLLVSPASRREIVLGKLGAICVMSGLSAGCAVTGIVAAMQFGFSMARQFIGIGFSISYPAVATMMLVVVPLSCMTSALLLIVSTFARNQKEAQAYVFPLLMMIMLPAMSTLVIGAEAGIGFSLVPVLNTALVMKQVLAGRFDLPFLALALVSSAIYAGIAMKLSTLMFEREDMLFRS